MMLAVNAAVARGPRLILLFFTSSIQPGTARSADSWPRRAIAREISRRIVVSTLAIDKGTGISICQPQRILLVGEYFIPTIGVDLNCYKISRSSIS